LTEFDDPFPIDNKTPLFAHECAGMYEDDEVPSGHESPKHDLMRDYDPEKMDLNDPTLERFPSNREDIIDTVRKLEGGLNEDQASFEGVPPSPVVGPSGRRDSDVVGELLTAVPVSTSPVASRGSRRHDLQKSPFGSISSDWSSAVSLHSISEAEEADDHSPPVIFKPSHASKPWDHSARAANSDDDEGVSMKARSALLNSAKVPGEDVSPKTGPVDASGSKVSNISDTLPKLDTDGMAESENSRSHTPGADTPETVNDENPRIVINPSTIDVQDNTVAKSSAVDAGSSSQVTKRGPTGERVSTPSSNRSPRITGSKSNWFMAFLRVLFVDWIGGLIARLRGARRKM
jgi:hypothetical protein